MATFVGVAERCVADEPKERLEMTEIIIQLELALVQQERYGVSSLTPEISVGVEQLLSASNEIKMMNSRRKPCNVWSTVRKNILKIWKHSSCKMHLVDISAPSSLHCLEGGGGIPYTDLIAAKGDVILEFNIGWLKFSLAISLH